MDVALTQGCVELHLDRRCKTDVLTSSSDVVISPHSHELCRLFDRLNPWTTAFGMKDGNGHDVVLSGRLDAFDVDQFPVWLVQKRDHPYHQADHEGGVENAKPGIQLFSPRHESMMPLTLSERAPLAGSGIRSASAKNRSVLLSLYAEPSATAARPPR